MHRYESLRWSRTTLFNDRSSKCKKQYCNYKFRQVSTTPRETSLVDFSSVETSDL